PPESPFDDEASKSSGFKIGFAEDRNKKYRRTMEDSHSFFYNFGESQGSGWFAIFDGHAGKSAADWCGANLHKTFHHLLAESPHLPIPEILNKTFLGADMQLAAKDGMYSGCTVVVGFVRTEERVVKGSSGGPQRMRVLYTANVGDARAVLNRKGTAIRLSYDHKGSDPQEAQRIVEAGGFILNNRVNGVLAVTRSLGDLTMKEWVIGSPYTTETVLDSNDSMIIFACDGLWDVCEDQGAIDLVKDVADPQTAADNLLDHALENFSTDNLSIVVVRLDTAFRA
ncbi:phosphatase 2C-like domain-containing protein, partial [Blyttiomyces helicus]